MTRAPKGVVLWALVVIDTFSAPSASSLLNAGSSTLQPVADAWRAASNLSVSIRGGGSSAGARSVCAAHDDPSHVHIGSMSRNWMSSEAVLLDDDYTYECRASGNRITQLVVGIDGLALVVSKNGAAHRCLTSPSMGSSLTFAQIRWMFTNWTDNELAVDNVDMSSVVPNDDGDGVKEWSDLSRECLEVPINPYGAGDQSGTHDFFGETVLCANCFKGKSGYLPEYFPDCRAHEVRWLEHIADPATIENYMAARRAPNCYKHSEDDSKVLRWVVSDTGGIGYVGFAYYSNNMAELTVVRVADDTSLGVRDTSDASVAPSAHSIVDGSYPLARLLYMNVDNAFWNTSFDFLLFGFSEAGQSLVASVGYATLNVALRSKQIRRINLRGNDHAQYVQVGRRCSGCPAGTFPVEGATSCAPCPRGTYSMGNVSLCFACDEGSFSTVEGSSACALCDEEVNGSTTVSRAAVSGWECVCRKGSYLDGERAGNASCVSCPAHSETLSSNSTSSSACLCMAGRYMTADVTACVPCPEGMHCSGGNGPPDVDAGYWAASSDAVDRVYSVYRCRDTKQCLRGPAGSNCAPNRYGIACAKCSLGTTPDRDSGGCSRCDETTTAQFFRWVFVILVAFAVLFGLLCASRVELATMKLNSISLAFCLGQVPLVAQVLVIFVEVEVEWYEPMKSFLSAVSILSFKIEFLDVGCLVSEDNPLAVFISKLVLYPVAVSLLCVLFSAIANIKYEVVQTHMRFNSLGVIFLILHMALTAISVSPFHCLQSPNGVSTVSSDPSLMCQTSDADYVAMAVLGALGILLYTLAFLAHVLYMVSQYPKIVKEGSFEQMQKYRYIFLRFTAECYYFAPVILLRGLIIAFLPVIFANYRPRQIVGMLVVVVVYAGLQAWLQPWRTSASNVLDAMVSACFIMVLVGGGVALGIDATRGSQVKSDMQFFFTLVVAVLMSVIVGIVGRNVFRHFRPVRSYKAFLSHHKGGCAVGARLMKMELSERINGRVFLDSDELDDLSSLLELLRSRSQRLVILLTARILWRPWCAGEIATAFLNKIGKICVAYDDYLEPSEDELTIESLSSRLSGDTWCMVTAHGVSLEHVRDAYIRVRGDVKLMVRRVGCNMARLPELKLSISEVVSAVLGRPYTGRAKSERPDALISPDVVVLGDNMSGEAVSYAQVLSRMLRHMTQRHVMELFDPSDVESLKGTASIVVCLTPGAITSLAFAQAITAAHCAWKEVPVLAVQAPDFAFPVKSVIERLVYRQMAGAIGQPIEFTRAAYNVLSSSLALPFGPGGNAAVMAAEVRALDARLNVGGFVFTDPALRSRASSRESSPREVHLETSMHNVLVSTFDLEENALTVDWRRVETGASDELSHQESGSDGLLDGDRGEVPVRPVDTVDTERSYVQSGRTSSEASVRRAQSFPMIMPVISIRSQGRQPASQEATTREIRLSEELAAIRKDSSIGFESSGDSESHVTVHL